MQAAKSSVRSQASTPKQSKQSSTTSKALESELSRMEAKTNSSSKDTQIPIGPATKKAESQPPATFSCSTGDQ